MPYPLQIALANDFVWQQPHAPTSALPAASSISACGRGSQSPTPSNTINEDNPTAVSASKRRWNARGPWSCSSSCDLVSGRLTRIASGDQDLTCATVLWHADSPLRLVFLVRRDASRMLWTGTTNRALSLRFLRFFDQFLLTLCAVHLVDRNGDMERHCHCADPSLKPQSGICALGPAAPDVLTTTGTRKRSSCLQWSKEKAKVSVSMSNSVEILGWKRRSGCHRIQRVQNCIRCRCVSYEQPQDRRTLRRITGM
ncbi:hypothetical protein C8F01DRAFT_1237502 [Mycena amicta]|nr:hypothetical protein C8F01DRAFT_1237502 [Mycena amicta]